MVLLCRHVRNVPRDDDIDWTIIGLVALVALMALVERGADLTTEHIAELWLDRLPYMQVHTAERLADRNLVNGRSAADAAEVNDESMDWFELGDEKVGVPSLAISFTSRQESVTAWYETPFAAASRPADGRLVPALRWADVGTEEHGLAVLNGGRYGHETLGSRIRAHLARGSYDPDRLGDFGTEKVVFSVVPHVGSWRDSGIVEAAAAVNAPRAGHLCSRVPVWSSPRSRPLPRAVERSSGFTSRPGASPQLP